MPPLGVETCGTLNHDNAPVTLRLNAVPLRHCAMGVLCFDAHTGFSRPTADIASECFHVLCEASATALCPHEFLRSNMKGTAMKSSTKLVDFMEITRLVHVYPIGLLR